MTSVQRLEVKLQRPNAIFEMWLERWLQEAESKGYKSRHKLREALEALKMYPLPLSSGRECAILRGFGKTLCNLIDDEMRKQQEKAQVIALNSSRFEQDVQQVVESVKKAKHSAQTKKDARVKLSKKQEKALKEEEERVKLVEMAAGTFHIILLVDVQETSGKNKKLLYQTRSYLESLHVKYEVRRLTIGDFLWIARDREGNELVLPYIVERKRMDDLASSIRDGRFHEQKHRLKQCGLPNIFYLIEDYGDNEHLGLPLANLRQAMTNLVIHNNFSLIHTEDHCCSIHYLGDMTQLLIRLFKDCTLQSCSKEYLNDNPPNCFKSDGMEANVQKLLKFKTLYEDSARNAQLTCKEIFIQQLLQLHSLSLEKALAIVEMYLTPRSLFDAYDNCDSLTQAQNLLKNIRCGQLLRPIGEKISRTIHDFYRSLF